jgi:SagB-type dehydrogenase family enzyme
MSRSSSMRNSSRRTNRPSRSSASGARLARAPDILITCEGRGFLVKDLDRSNRVEADLRAIAVLSLFERPRSQESVVQKLIGLGRDVVLTTIRQQRAFGLLLPEKEWKRRVSRLQAWNQNLASALYHVASRDGRYIRGSRALDDYLTARAASSRRPPLFKRYPRSRSVALPSPTERRDPASLAVVLAARRTVRSFSSEPVQREDLSSILRGTWGQTGWLDGGPLGRLVAKTSPSGGGLHPIECYVLAWKVRGLPAGLYHYDASGNRLRRLKAGDFRAAAVRAASGQSWVGRAGFLCVMTAVFQRTLWKYQFETAYRVVWLDAGHLAQTFCLLATALGLGPFSTAAIQDSYIEKLIGIDGIKEFPVYLCGAGVPAKKLL